MKVHFRSERIGSGMCARTNNGDGPAVDVHNPVAIPPGGVNDEDLVVHELRRLDDSEGNQRVLDPCGIVKRRVKRGCARPAAGFS